MPLVYSSPKLVVKWVVRGGAGCACPTSHNPFELAIVHVQKLQKSSEDKLWELQKILSNNLL